MKIKVCMGKNCVNNNFAFYIVDRLKRDVERFNLENVEVEEVGCLGMCEKGPIVKIDKQILEYATPIKASEMLFKKLNNNHKKKEDKPKKERNYEEEDNFSLNEVIY